jgi:hypothetical protein
MSYWAHIKKCHAQGIKPLTLSEFTAIAIQAIVIGRAERRKTINN